MRKSKIEMYISILETLAYNGPSKITRITHKVKMNFSQLRPITDDLIQESHKDLNPIRTIKNSVENGV